jgi:hypothetical protein
MPVWWWPLVRGGLLKGHIDQEGIMQMRVDQSDAPLISSHLFASNGHGAWRAWLVSMRLRLTFPSFGKEE